MATYKLNQNGSPNSLEQALHFVNDKETDYKSKLKPYFRQDNFVLYKEDCLEILDRLPDDYVDTIFADPPYMLSNNGFTCQNGRMVSVNKGKWDKSKGVQEDIVFHREWIKACYRILKPGGTIWISGTYHSIYQCGYLLQEVGYKILNDIAWFKPNASPNLSCRYFTASHETLIWARKGDKTKHVFNYDDMKNGSFPKDFIKKPGKQMRSVWAITTPKKGEKEFGKHPTQKPLALLLRALKASTEPGHLILDPFCGSGTTGIASELLGNRKFIGIDLDEAFLAIAKNRKEKLMQNEQNLF